MVGGRRDDGFTLVEVLVALVVLGVGLLGVLGMSLLAGRTLTRAVVVQRAGAVAEVVADSLVRVRGSGSGAEMRERIEVEWSAGGGGIVFRARPVGSSRWVVDRRVEPW